MNTPVYNKICLPRARKNIHVKSKITKVFQNIETYFRIELWCTRIFHLLHNSHMTPFKICKVMRFYIKHYSVSAKSDKKTKIEPFLKSHADDVVKDDNILLPISIKKINTT